MQDPFSWCVTTAVSRETGRAGSGIGIPVLTQARTWPRGATQAAQRLRWTRSTPRRPQRERLPSVSTTGEAPSGKGQSCLRNMLSAFISASEHGPRLCRQASGSHEPAQASGEGQAWSLRRFPDGRSRGAFSWSLVGIHGAMFSEEEITQKGSPREKSALKFTRGAEHYLEVLQLS